MHYIQKNWSWTQAPKKKNSENNKQIFRLSTKMSLSLCYKCERDIDDDEDYSECDCCASLFHLKCVGVTKTEAKARKNSKCLKLYCPECFEVKNNDTPEKLKEILALLYKMDCCMQQQKTANFTASIEQKLTALDQKLDAQCNINANDQRQRS